jgi:peptide/nickel transport system ATP-binding protein
MIKDTKMSTEKLLTIRDLRIEGKSGGVWSEIVHGVDLDLRRSEILGLIGESGAGKSTIGLAAMGYSRDGCRISSGSINFDGIDLLTASEKERRQLRGHRIAYVAQSAAASFNPAHRLIDQYTEGPIVHGVANRKTAELDAIELYHSLRLPNPDEIGFRYPHQVSGGQLQRAMTAMAMSCKPDLIIFDEPTTALDVTTQIEVLEAIRNIVRQFNTAAIYITHDLAVVSQMADRIKVLLKGNEVEEAPTAQMLSNPKEDYTKSLWAIRSYQTETKPHTRKEEVPIISVQNVDGGYGTLKILKDVSIDIYRGRTVAVVGESGSGKSTVARAIMGLLEPSSGEIMHEGEVLPSSYKSRGKEQLRRTQMIYQAADTAINSKQRIREIIGRPLEFYHGLKGKEQDKRVRELLSEIDLDPDTYIDRFPGELSGGQKQRIGIARALAANPDFIICDEVTSALDQLVAEGILRLLKRLQERHNIAYLFITHDIASVRAIADEIVVMQEGKVVETGSRAEMFMPPHHPYTELLLSSVPEMDPGWLDSVLTQRIKID